MGEPRLSVCSANNPLRPLRDYLTTDSIYITVSCEQNVFVHAIALDGQLTQVDRLFRRLYFSPSLSQRPLGLFYGTSKGFPLKPIRDNAVQIFFHDAKLNFYKSEHLTMQCDCIIVDLNLRLIPKQLLRPHFY